MGLNKPITVGGGLTAAEVQAIIDAQTTAITDKVDAQTDTLKADIPSSISGGASISDINAALDEKLPQYQNGAVVKSKQIVYAPAMPNNNITNDILTLATSKGYTEIHRNDAGNIYITHGASPNNLIECVKEIAGNIVITPVDKSKALIFSKTKSFFDNRNYNTGIIDRDIEVKILQEGSYWDVYTCNVLEDSIMCLEFN